MVDLLSTPVDALLPGEVFVFGSNRGGFHGVGSAGLACRGDAGRDWRSDARFRAMIDSAPGSPIRVGEWAVFGMGRGHQVGTRGQSYAIETIERPGREYRRSTPLRVIEHQLHELVTFATGRPDLRFLVTPLAEGYAGYTREEMAGVWRRINDDRGIPPSFQFIRLTARDTNPR